MAKNAQTVRALACIVLGAFSFVMLLPGVFEWIGLVAAVAAVVLGWTAVRRPKAGKSADKYEVPTAPGRLQLVCIVGIVLAVLAALISLLTERL